MSFLKNQITGQSTQPIATEYKRLLKKEMIDDAATWDWAAKGYSIYPSGITFGMCCYDFIRSRHIFSGIDKEKSKDSTEEGKAQHAKLQRVLIKSSKIPYKVMCYPHSESAEKLARKLKADSTECPIVDPASGISGSVDSPPWRLDKSRLACFDIKSTTEHDEKNWQAKKITKQYLTQISVYAYLWNRDGYWPEKVNTVGILYVNNAKDCWDMDRYREIYEPFTPELEARAKLLLDHLELERTRLLEGKESSCTYPECTQHGSKE